MKFKTFLLIVSILLLNLAVQLFIVKDYNGAVFFFVVGCLALIPREHLEDV